MRVLRLIAAALCVAGLLFLAVDRAGAAQRSAPGWWDPDGVGSGHDWHYRIAVTLPATSTVNSTAKVDIDFMLQMTQLGISGMLDANSIRVVRPNGSLATVQEYNDSVYAGVTDTSLGRGEVRWIVQDGGAQTYQVYFDITANGTKPANPQTPINGNFEHSTTGTAVPAGWASATKADASFDMQVRPSEFVNVSTAAAEGDSPYNTDGTAQSGGYSYLIGARTNEETIDSLTATALVRTFVVPASNPGNFDISWRAEGWDGHAYDSLTITLTGSGGTTMTVVGNSLGTYGSFPTSPNYGDKPLSNLNSGYGFYNRFDTKLDGSHELGMAVSPTQEKWWSRSVSLSAFAGQTVTLKIATAHGKLLKTWFHVDGVAWSVVAGSLGQVQAFGVAATSPSGTLTAGQTVIVSAIVDAKPLGNSYPVLADIVDATGAPVAVGIKLFNDGSHGDAIANDAIWTNDGSDGANSTYVIPASGANPGSWKLRIIARDASASTIDPAYNGILHRNGQPTAFLEANWSNIAEGSFTVDVPLMTVAKTMTIVANGIEPSGWKAIPGATVRYCVVVSNTGTVTATNVMATDVLPSTLTYVPGSIRSGYDCPHATTVEDDDTLNGDEADPAGASYVNGTITVVVPTFPAAGTLAVTYDVIVK